MVVARHELLDVTRDALWWCPRIFLRSIEAMQSLWVPEASLVQFKGYFQFSKLELPFKLLPLHCFKHLTAICTRWLQKGYRQEQDFDHIQTLGGSEY